MALLEATTIHFPITPDIPSDYGDKKLIKEVLQNKNISVTVFNVKHSGDMPDDLVAEYGSYDLRTLEVMFSSFDEYLSVDSNRPQNVLERTFFGLGPNPKFSMDLLSETKMTESTDQYGYYSKAISTYNDVRGVDFSIAQLWAARFMQGEVSQNLFPHIDEKVGEELTTTALVHVLNSMRDYSQAYVIAKILALYTHDRQSATLAHIGGANHVALPIFLKGLFGIDAHMMYLDLPPDAIRRRLLEVVPPHESLPLIKSMDITEFEYNAEGLKAKLDPHVDELVELIDTSD